MQRTLSPRLAIGITVAFVLAACTPAAVAPSSALPSSKPSLPATPSPSASADPSESPETAQPTPSQADGGQVEFSVAPNPAADSLFLVRDECENAEDGYRLQFPEDWYTNTEIGDVPPCSWFGPTSYAADPSGAVPDEIAITIEYLTGDTGSFEEVVSREQGIVGATQTAVRVEYRGAEGEGGMQPPDWRQYLYLVQLGPTEEEGPNLLVQTNTDMGGDYELNKAVLDRIMATIEFLGTIQ